MSKAEVLAKCDQMKAKLDDTFDAVVGMRSVEADILRAVVPIFSEQLELIRLLAAE